MLTEDLENIIDKLDADDDEVWEPFENYSADDLFEMIDNTIRSAKHLVSDIDNHGRK